MLGTNGGGFFNANSAHPYENPNALTNFVQIVLIFALGAALTNVFGRMVGDQRQGWAIFAAMGVLFLVGVLVAYWAEAAGNPAFATLGVDTNASALQAGGNMEGKEVRFGIANSALFAAVTTAASCGAVNAMHDSFTPLGGLVPLFNIQLGEVIVGGVGAGLYGMLLFAIIAVFIAGLMVGRTPEYLGKKIEAREVKMTMLAILILPLSILGFTALATVVDAGLAGPANPGPHGFSEILYAYTSGTGNNGTAFAGLTANTLFYNTTLGLAMFIGRFLMIVPMLAIAGSLAAKKIVPAVGRHLPDQRPAVRRPAGRRDPDRRRPDLLPGARARPDRRALRDAGRHTLLESRTVMVDMAPSSRADVGFHARPIRRSSGRPLLDAFRKLDPRVMITQPGDVHGRGGGGADHGPVHPRPRDRRRRARLLLPDQSLALVHRAVRQLRRGRGRGPRQGAGGDLAQDQDRDGGQAAAATPASTDFESLPATGLKQGDLVLVEAGDLIPSDGEVIEGVASVNEAAITGESAPVIRESGGDRSAVTGGTQVISDWIKVRITAQPGSTFLDRMIALVEGAERQKTPNEIALNILLAGMTIIFVFAVATRSRASPPMPAARCACWCWWRCSSP